MDAGANREVLVRIARIPFVSRLLFIFAASKTSLDRVVLPFVVSDLNGASLALLALSVTWLTLWSLASARLPL